MTTTSTESESTNAAVPEIAPDGSATAVSVRRFGGLQLSWDKLLTTVPIYVGLIIIWIYFDSQTTGHFIGRAICMRWLKSSHTRRCWRSVWCLSCCWVRLTCRWAI